ncbi:MAG TPA: PAS domain-containing sensor histidine kinase, partial [Anaerolineales bacterium]|nr:PAS domain-containing sensor histidine kinase [Anaerolineales bacterium]
MIRPRLPADPKRAATLVGAGLLALAALLAAAQPSPTGGMAGLGILALVLLRTGAGLQSLATANRLVGDATRRAWRFLATAWILAALSAAFLWGGWALRGEILQVPSVADLLLLAGVSCALWAVASYGAGPKERFGRLRNWLDIAIVLLSVGGLSWLTLLQPVLEVGIASPVKAFWGLLWPALDLIFLALVLRLLLLAERGHERWSLGLLGLAGVVALAGNLAAGLAAITGDAQPAWRVEVLWMMAALLAALAAFEGGRAPIRPSPGAGVRRGRASQAEALLPIAFTYAAVGYVGVDAWIQGSVDPFGLGIAIALSLLLFARQGVVAGQSEMRQYTALVEGAADIAFICQADGTVAFSNRSFDAALGRGPAHSGSLHLREVLAPGFELAPVLERASAEGWSGEVLFHRLDGSRFPARLSLQPVVLERQRRPVLAATAVDLGVIKEREALLRSALDDVAAARTELMALNRDLEAKVGERTLELQRTVEDLDRLNQELRALDRMKSEFVTLVSHELRAPLTNIQAGVELLLPAESGVPEPARTSLRLIQEETARLGSFVEAILDLSALDAGRFPLRVAPLDFAAQARGAVDRFRSMQGHERIRVQLDDGLPPVQADERALASVLYHLLDNALKYAPEGPIDLGAEAEPDRLVAWIRDRGPGIPEADRERVFDMFHRLDSSDAREVYGHGLGLHLVRRLLEAMGGGIRSDTAAGGGA